MKLPGQDGLAGEQALASNRTIMEGRSIQLWTKLNGEGWLPRPIYKMLYVPSVDRDVSWKWP